MSPASNTIHRRWPFSSVRVYLSLVRSSCVQLDYNPRQTFSDRLAAESVRHRTNLGCRSSVVFLLPVPGHELRRCFWKALFLNCFSFSPWYFPVPGHDRGAGRGHRGPEARGGAHNLRQPQRPARVPRARKKREPPEVTLSFHATAHVRFNLCRSACYL